MPNQSLAPTARQQLDAFIDKFSADVAASARLSLKHLRKRLPGATEIVYDNYNALAIGFGPSEKASEAIFSIAIFPRWVSLFFLQGVGLSDPKKLLKGGGTKVRHIVLKTPGDIVSSDVDELIARALKSAKIGIDPNGKRTLLIKSVSAKQRPRRPSPTIYRSRKLVVKKSTTD
jgi:hypothetical protein